MYFKKIIFPLYYKYVIQPEVSSQAQSFFFFFFFRQRKKYAILLVLPIEEISLWPELSSPPLSVTHRQRTEILV